MRSAVLVEALQVEGGGRGSHGCRGQGVPVLGTRDCPIFAL